VSFGVEERYGGFGLPALVTNLLLQMIARADAGLMTLPQLGVPESGSILASGPCGIALTASAVCSS
jgi:alkylation response protein AidB-like acyl-CoA dehydrogenase